MCASALYRFHNSPCPYCGRVMKLPWCGAYHLDINKVDAPSRDHVTPLVRGGPDISDNILVVCRGCNNLKEDLTLSEYHAHLVAEGSEDADRIAALLPHYAQFKPEN